MSWHKIPWKSCTAFVPSSTDSGARIWRKDSVDMRCPKRRLKRSRDARWHEHTVDLDEKHGNQQKRELLFSSHIAHLTGHCNDYSHLEIVEPFFYLLGAHLIRLRTHHHRGFIVNVTLRFGNAKSNVKLAEPTAGSENILVFLTNLFDKLEGKTIAPYELIMVSSGYFISIVLESRVVGTAWSRWWSIEASSLTKSLARSLLLSQVLKALDKVC